jgi:hypothetical protein
MVDWNTIEGPIDDRPEEFDEPNDGLPDIWPDDDFHLDLDEDDYYSDDDEAE